jgi:SAM-dependent methyltransferase
VYRVERAESTSLDDASVDLLCVAQALHWFEFEVFYREAKRVLKREGVIAVWAYHNVILPTTALQEIVNHYYHEIVGPYWPAEIKLLEEKYETIPFPFAEINPPAFVMKVNWSLENFVGYLESWSSSRRYFLDKGKNPLDEIREKLENAWGDPASEKLVSWPLFLRVGRKIESSPS